MFGCLWLVLEMTCMFYKVSFLTECDVTLRDTTSRRFLPPTHTLSKPGRQIPRQQQEIPLSCPTCESSGLVRGDSSEVAQVALVAHEHDDDVAVGVVPQLLQPPLHILVREVLGDVVHQQCPHSSTVVPGDRRTASQTQ